MLNFNLQINFKSIFQYTLIYLLISTQKGILTRFLGNQFLVLIFTISVIYFVFHINVVKQNIAVFCMLAFTWFLMFITMIVTGGSLSVTTILRYLLSFLFILVAVSIDRKHFLERYLKLVYFISIISLLGFVFFVILKLPYYTLLYHNNGYYGLLFYNFRPFSFIGDRNVGISSEPGQFQIIVSSALYFTLFKHKFSSTKKFIKYAMVFIVTLLTIQSTTGYFALGAIFLGYIFSKLYEKSYKKMRKYIICLCIAGSIYTLANINTDNFITVNFINKIFDSNYNLNLNQNTGGERVLSMATDLKMIHDYPFGMGFSLYENLWAEYAPLYSGFLSCSGITRDMAIIGIAPELIFLIFIFAGIWKNKISYLDFILGIFLFVNTGFSQTSSLNSCLMLIALYPKIPFCLKKTLPVKEEYAQSYE